MPTKKPLSRIEMFDKIAPGMSMSYRIGSDVYGYWISNVDYDNFIIECYMPDAKFAKSWQDGEMIADPFDPNQKPNIKFKYKYGCWYSYYEPTNTWTKTYTNRLFIDNNPPRIYRDPSF